MSVSAFILGQKGTLFFVMYCLLWCLLVIANLILNQKNLKTYIYVYIDVNIYFIDRSWLTSTKFKTRLTRRKISEINSWNILKNQPPYSLVKKAGTSSKFFLNMFFLNNLILNVASGRYKKLIINFFQLRTILKIWNTFEGRY